MNGAPSPEFPPRALVSVQVWCTGGALGLSASISAHPSRQYHQRHTLRSFPTGSLDPLGMRGRVLIFEQTYLPHRVALHEWQRGWGRNRWRRNPGRANRLTATAACGCSWRPRTQRRRADAPKTMGPSSSGLSWPRRCIWTTSKSAGSREGQQHQQGVLSDGLLVGGMKAFKADSA